MEGHLVAANNKPLRFQDMELGSLVTTAILPPPAAVSHCTVRPAKVNLMVLGHSTKKQWAAEWLFGRR